MSRASGRALLEAVLRRSLRAMDLERRTGAALGAPPPVPVHVVAIGKAAPAMAAGALRVWSRRIARTLVVTTDRTDVSRIAHREGVTVLRGAHPLPDRRSVVAGEACRRFVSEAGAGSLVLVLVSGGASALACAPSAGVRLADKRAVTRAMLASGASIQEINLVRKHLSRIKGGGLARAAGEAKLLTLIASDVIAGEPSDVGSGPSIVAPSRVAAARRLLAKHAPDHAALPLARTTSPRSASRGRAVVVAAPEELARVAAVELGRKGVEARTLPASQAGVGVLALEYAQLARRLRPGEALVRAAEPAVDVPRAAAKARGGRSTHLAALVGAALPPGVLFLAAATDGVDGSSGTAGAIVDASVAKTAGFARLLARFDTGPLHRRAGTALPEHSTGHNLADLHVLCRFSPSR